MPELNELYNIVQAFGWPAIALYFWWADTRATRKIQTEHSDRHEEIVCQFAANMKSVQQMYKNNVDLVRNYNKLTDELTALLAVSTESNTRLIDRIDQIETRLNK